MDTLIERYIQAAWETAAENRIRGGGEKPGAITAKIPPSKSANRPSGPSIAEGYWIEPAFI